MNKEVFRKHLRVEIMTMIFEAITLAREDQKNRILGIIEKALPCLKVQTGQRKVVCKSYVVNTKHWCENCKLKKEIGE